MFWYLIYLLVCYIIINNSIISFNINSIPAGLHGNTCNVFPKDQYIERGSDTQITCQTSCVHGEIYWTLDNISQDKTLSERINSSHTVLSLKNFTNQRATLQCHSEVTKQILGGTTIRSYSNGFLVLLF